ncbi:DNA-methyltransferase [Candidatus Poriferisodalis sp.]|uniref:DNA-methyltransferase n=1 Tax=Candidatus Poriferisodalis sp. TaxID=3101277 RepID=UPI003C706132
MADTSIADAVRSLRLELSDPSRDLPRIAKDRAATPAISEAVRTLHTEHRIVLADAADPTMWRQLIGQVDLVVTSPPYWNLKEYSRRDGQLGSISDYEEFLDRLTPVWQACYEALTPGGRLVIVVGDVCLSRRRNNGRHTVVPLHASIQEQCRKIGLDNLAPIFWHKIANARHESGGGSGACLGKPYEPNSVLKNDIEYILMQRKPGGYRSVPLENRVLSVIPKDVHSQWFRQIWDGPPGASTKQHPAPFPEELSDRLIRMFSFVGDTVLDPFMGSGTTLVSAAKWGRHSIGIDIEPAYVDMARERLEQMPNAWVLP